MYFNYYLNVADMAAAFGLTNNHAVVGHGNLCLANSSSNHKHINSQEYDEMCPNSFNSNTFLPVCDDFENQISQEHHNNFTNFDFEGLEIMDILNSSTLNDRLNICVTFLFFLNVKMYPLCKIINFFFHNCVIFQPLFSVSYREAGKVPATLEGGGVCMDFLEGPERVTMDFLKAEACGGPSTPSVNN